MVRDRSVVLGLFYYCIMLSWMAKPAITASPPPYNALFLSISLSTQTQTQYDQRFDAFICVNPHRIHTPTFTYIQRNLTARFGAGGRDGFELMTDRPILLTKLI